MVKNLHNVEKKVKKIKYWTKRNRKMGGRSFNSTRGAFGGTLLFTCGAGLPVPIVSSLNYIYGMCSTITFQCPPPLYNTNTIQCTT